jgi:hypothetical protein
MPPKKTIDADSEATKLAATQAVVTKQFKFNKSLGVPQSEEETLAVHRFLTEPARVEVSLGLTLNLTNYESAKITIGITVPCYKEETEDAFAWAKDWVEKRVSAEVENIRHKKDNNIL